MAETANRGLSQLPASPAARGSRHHQPDSSRVRNGGGLEVPAGLIPDAGTTREGSPPLKGDPPGQWGPHTRKEVR